ncbi:MAG: FadR family transcriptional regulator [Tessaracoccus sp.]|uniref:FadR/GntR family transcriptional regulator n=1 Tax=Tessaracoccus sp. TaxID=1971211 RepID=UPI001EB4A4A1|nr:FCD domain-containing protein [Tessaracoccus sp.]MBK7819688.1 FadR family transcriptional regulator [Tessaracoccus sp.]
MQRTSVSAVETARRGLCQLIATGELATGAPLPSEAELCERFGVSRSSLREAQRMLTVAGALVARPGSSAAVSDMSARQMMSGLEMVAPLLPLERYLELFTLREVLEGHVAAQAAARMSDDEAAELLRVARELAECEPSDRAQLLDTQFHTQISEAAGDEVLAALLDTIRRRGRDYRIFEDSAHHHLKGVSDDAHIEIAAAIRRRDPEGARALAMHHVRVTRSWLEGIRPGPVLFQHF